ncbi:MAG TPA: arginine--tRNA ligase [Candidatus Dormibacteraeota bacterium]|nr:arginine--tRNA ligase [Candidatus Dormibacteraeota bacterium]
MKSEITDIIQTLCSEQFNVDIQANITRPEKQFGDFSTNVAMQLAPMLKKSPLSIAENLVSKLNNLNKFSKVELVAPGFINITLKDDDILSVLKQKLIWSKVYSNKQVLVEYGDPNAFKEMHLGHVYSSIVGDVISSLLKSSGADVKSLIYQGDVGLNIAKGIYGIGEHINWDISLLDTATKEKSIGFFYAEGEKAYHNNPAASERIKLINSSIYTKDDDQINYIYDFGKKMSFDQFDKIFDEIGVHFDKRYLESQSAIIGKNLVEDNIGKVFEKSQGAIVYKGEQDGLYTAVFITSQGLPTYQAKDLGLTQLKSKDFPEADKSIIITANEQDDNFKVVFAALAKIDPELAKRTIHISHGFLTLTTGKMSSRTGDVYTGTELIESIKQAIEEQYPDSKVKKDIFMAALRYTFIKQRIGANIVFNPKESVTIEGNSGPYIQYAHARAKNILAKLTDSNYPSDVEGYNLEADERNLISLMSQFPEIVEQSINEYMPHHICNFLYQLAQEFNSFYERNRVIDDPRQDLRVRIVNYYARILKTGLDLLHIPAPDYM